MIIKNIKRDFSKILNNEKSFINNIKNDKVTIFSKSMPSIISQDLKINGELQSFGTIEIEGCIKGNIKSHSIIIREDGIVEGEIIAEIVSIKGQFNGNIKAKNVNIFGKAKFTGGMEYDSLSVEDGASIDGQFKQINKDSKQ